MTITEKVRKLRLTAVGNGIDPKRLVIGSQEMTELLKECDPGQVGSFSGGLKYKGLVITPASGATLSVE